MLKTAIALTSAVLMMGFAPSVPSTASAPAFAAKQSAYNDSPEYERCMRYFGCEKFNDGSWQCPYPDIDQICGSGF